MHMKVQEALIHSKGKCVGGVQKQREKKRYQDGGDTSFWC